MAWCFNADEAAPNLWKFARFYIISIVKFLLLGLNGYQSVSFYKFSASLWWYLLYSDHYLVFHCHFYVLISNGCERQDHRI